MTFPLLRRGPGPRVLVNAALLLLVGGLAACRSSAAGTSAPQPVGPGPVVLGESELAAVFARLVAAIEAHANDEAQRIVARLRLFDLDSDARRKLVGCERVLRGRAALEETHLRLVSELADGHVTLTAEVSTPSTACVLRPSAPAVRLHWTTIYPTGEEERLTTTLAAPDLVELRLDPGDTRVVRLGRYPLPIGRALASRMRFDLELGAGEVEIEGQRYPAMHYRVEACEVVRLAPFLPSAAIDPAELVSYVRGNSFRIEALLERAVRIAPARRREALDALTPVALGLDRVRLTAIAPALRWLSGNARFGADAETWRSWFEARAAELASGARPLLDLPDSLRGVDPDS